VTLPLDVGKADRFGAFMEAVVVVVAMTWETKAWFRQECNPCAAHRAG
jgi:hypothetical protein